MASWQFFNVSEEVINMIAKNSIIKNTKDAMWLNTFQKKNMKFLLIKSNKPATLELLAYLNMSNHHNIVTKCVQHVLHF